MGDREISITGFPRTYNEIKLRVFIEKHTGKDTVQQVTKKEDYVVIRFFAEQDLRRYHDLNVREMVFGDQVYELTTTIPEHPPDRGLESNDLTSNWNARDVGKWRKMLYVTKIPDYLMNYLILKQHFERFGRVERLYLNAGKAFVHVTYTNHRDACIAKERARNAGPNSMLSISWCKHEKNPTEETVSPVKRSRQRMRSSNQQERKNKQELPPLDQPTYALPEGSSTSSKPASVKLSLDTVHFWHTFSVLPAPEETRCLLVQNIDPSTHAQNIVMHFENKKRSDGGPVLAVIQMVDGMLVAFRDEQDCARVLDKKDQKFSGKDIIIFPKFIPTYYEKKFVVTGVGEETSVDTLELFLEGCSMNETSPLSCEKKELPGVYLITYDDHYDTTETDELLRKIRSRQLEDNRLKASKLLQTDCLKITSIPLEVSNDAIKLILESKKRTNGGQVTRIDRLRNDAALVFFALYTDAQRVFERFGPTSGERIEIEKYKVSVELYFHCLADDHTNTVKPSLKPKPEPKPRKVAQGGDVITFKYEMGAEHGNVVRFIQRNRKHVEKFRGNFEDLAQVAFVVMSNTDNGESNIDISFTPSKKGKSFESQAEFNDECRKKVLSFFDAFVTKSKKYDQFKLEKARSLGLYPPLERRFRGNWGNEDIYMHWNVRDSSTLEITGIKQDVDSMIEYISNCLECTEENMKINQDQFHIMTQCGITEELMKQHKNVKIVCDERTKNMKLTGQKSDIASTQIDALTLLNTVQKRKITGLRDCVLTFLSETLTGPSGMKSIIEQKFRERNIKASIGTDVDEPCLRFRADNEYQRAVNVLKEVIATDETRIDEQTSKVVSSPHWRRFQQNLKGTLPHRIFIKPNESIVLVGPSSELEKLRKEIMGFLDENVDRRIVVAAKYGQAKYVVERSRDFDLDSCRKKEVECGLTPDNGGGIFVKGKRRAIEQASKGMQSLIGKVLERKHTLQESGIMHYLEGEQGIKFIHDTEKISDCIILISSPECEEWVRLARQSRLQTNRPVSKVPLQPMLEEQELTSVKLSTYSVTLKVWKTDIVKHKCDVIINASNPELKLLLQGVSGVIKKLDVQNRNEIQVAMDAIIKHNHGSVLSGDAFITNAGNLPACKKIVHAVGPRWHSKSERGDPKLTLKACIFKSLEETHQAGLKSIAIPAISCGVFGGKVGVCVPLILEAVMDFFADVKRTTIKQVDFVENRSQDVLDEFVACVEKHRVKTAPSPAPRSSNMTPPASQSGTTTKVALKLGNIEDQTADVIVNVTTPQSVNSMQGSAVSKAILRKAGRNVLQQCAAIAGPHNVGSVLETGAGNLSCKKLYHAVVSHYDQKTGKRIVQSVVQQSLQRAKASGFRSIAFPAIATGGFNYPPKNVARWMNKEISKSSGIDVTIVLFPQNQAVMQAFNAEFNASSVPTQPSTTAANLFQKINSSSGTFGPYTVSVYQGDITNERSDVIVNSIDRKFDLSQGMVSAAILQKGGAIISNELKAATGTYMRITSSGNLNSQLIFHVVLPSNVTEMQKQIIKVLAEAENRGMASVSIPALGTGNIGLDVKAVASVLRASFETFAKSNPNPSTLTDINVVIFDQLMVQGFKDVILSTSSHGIFSWFKGKFQGLLSNPTGAAATFFSSPKETLDMFFYSVSDGNIEKAIKCVSDEVRKVTHCQVIEDEVIDRLSEWEKWEIKQVAEQHKVTIDDCSNKYIKQYKVEGLTSEVLKAHEAIKDILKDFSSAETTASFVNWQRLNNGVWEDYPKRAIHILEKANKARTSNVGLNIVKVLSYNNGNVSEHLVDLSDLDKANPSIRRKVNETEKSADALPQHWDDMKGKAWIKVILTQGTPEYNTALAKFTGGGVGGFFPNVVSLERIQNVSLYKQYVAKKNEVTNKLAGSGKQVEQQLFHGTADDDKILHHGFDRSYAGKNATVHGRGVYFARDASYSTNYAHPNAQGHRRMFLADVATGDYCQGHQSYVAPPAKPNSTLKNDLYDSVVDNLNSPRIYVIFKDASAYPTYLLTYY